MTNKSILERLIIDTNNYSKNKQNRADFAISFIDAIESLEDIPFSVIDEARDWQYKIETDGYVDQIAYEKQTSGLLVNLNHWLKALLKSYS